MAHAQRSSVKDSTSAVKVIWVEVLGQRIDLLFLMQLSVTAVLFFSFFTLRALRYAAGEQSGDAQTVILIDFVLAHSKAARSLKDLLGVEEAVLTAPPSRATTIASALDLYQQQNILPKLSDYSNPLAELRSGGWVIPIAPISGMFYFFMALDDERKLRTDVINHTDVRKNEVSAVFALLVVSFGYLLLALWTLSRGPARWVAILVVIFAVVAFLGVIGALGAFLVLLRQQSLWKGYWQAQLLDVMASSKDDHDLCNRCLILRGDVAREPSIPIPGAVTTYAVLFSIIQTVLVWISNRVTWF